MCQSVAHTLLCSTQCLQHKLKPHITNLSYASQLNTVIERYIWLRQARHNGCRELLLKRVMSAIVRQITANQYKI